MNVWPPKSPDETVSHRWTPELDRDESIATVTPATDSGTVTVTATNEIEHGKEGITAFVAGGSAGETARVSLEVTTSEGRTLVGVFHIAVRSEAPVLGNTARDVCNFALRKVVGNGETAEASELDDALERLNAMLMLWRINGLDVGVAKELTANDTLDIPDAYITAIKWCLREDIHAYYDVQMNGHDARMTEQAKAALAAHLINFDNLDFDRGLVRHTGGWDYDRGY